MPDWWRGNAFANQKWQARQSYVGLRQDRVSRTCNFVLQWVIWFASTITRGH